MSHYNSAQKVACHDPVTKMNKPKIDALSQFHFSYHTTDFKSDYIWPVRIEKTFGLLVKESNIVAKFRFILIGKKLQDDNRRINFQAKIIYLSEDPIDCEFAVYAEVLGSDSEPENITKYHKVDSEKEILISLLR